MRIEACLIIVRTHWIGLDLRECISLSRAKGTPEVIDREALRVRDKGLEGLEPVVRRAHIEREVAVAERTSSDLHEGIRLLGTQDGIVRDVDIDPVVARSSLDSQQVRQHRLTLHEGSIVHRSHLRHPVATIDQRLTCLI